MGRSRHLVVNWARDPIGDRTVRNHTLINGFFGMWFCSPCPGSLDEVSRMSLFRQPTHETWRVKGGRGQWGGDYAHTDGMLLSVSWGLRRGHHQGGVSVAPENNSRNEIVTRTTPVWSMPAWEVRSYPYPSCGRWPSVITGESMRPTVDFNQRGMRLAMELDS